MVNLDDIIRQLTTNAQAIQALLGNISNEQAIWKPDSETWSMQQVMEHVYNEERIDFRQHLQEMFSSPKQPWGGLQQEYIHVVSCQQALQDFLTERENSVAWLRSLESPDWDTDLRAKFGETEYLLRAGDVLVSWVAHDYLHIRQMNELLYAWNAKQAAPYSVEYGGEW